ncbi:hypothetical protein RRG08_027110 [Elysia crispata]|uniref:Uncharacterized protein n=1 Tax=Elysia crispata TaxID=231223 RepID=A0AAE0YYW9_9GAST|nr:hypothetical protein RRG08_027110 [Elysia crispata]
MEHKITTSQKSEKKCVVDKTCGRTLLFQPKNFPGTIGKKAVRCQKLWTWIKPGLQKNSMCVEDEVLPVTTGPCGFILILMRAENRFIEFLLLASGY